MGEPEPVDFSMLFGQRLLAHREGAGGKDSVKEISVTELEGKYVGIYFSAHWCASRSPAKADSPEPCPSR